MGNPKARTNWELSRNYEKLGTAVERGAVIINRKEGEKRLCQVGYQGPIRVWDFGIQTNKSHNRI